MAIFRCESCGCTSDGEFEVIVDEEKLHDWK
jgi:hypothetical protein